MRQNWSKVAGRLLCPLSVGWLAGSSCVGRESWRIIINHRPLTLEEMRSSSFDLENAGGVDQFEPFQQWEGSSLYAPTPGNFAYTPGSPSNLSLINTNNYLPVDQWNDSQTNKLPLLQFGEWEEGRAYDGDPPSCIHYWIEWKATFKNRSVAKDTEQDLVLAPGFVHPWTNSSNTPFKEIWEPIIWFFFILIPPSLDELFQFCEELLDGIQIRWIRG